MNLTILNLHVEWSHVTQTEVALSKRGLERVQCKKKLNIKQWQGKKQRFFDFFKLK